MNRKLVSIFFAILLCTTYGFGMKKLKLTKKVLEIAKSKGIPVRYYAYIPQEKKLKEIFFEQKEFEIDTDFSKYLEEFKKAEQGLEKKWICRSSFVKIFEDPELLKYALENNLIRDKDCEIGLELREMEKKVTTEKISDFLAVIGKEGMYGLVFGVLIGGIIVVANPTQSLQAALNKIGILGLKGALWCSLLGGLFRSGKVVEKKERIIREEEFGLLTYAAMMNKGDAVDIILDSEFGKNIGEKTSKGNNSVIFAAVNRNPEMLKRLFLSGADPNEQNNFGDTAAHMASFGGCCDTVQVLDQFGADFGLKNEKGEKPADVVTNLKVLEFLRAAENAETIFLDDDELDN